MISNDKNTSITSLKSELDAINLCCSAVNTSSSSPFNITNLVSSYNNVKKFKNYIVTSTISTLPLIQLSDKYQDTCI